MAFVITPLNRTPADRCWVHAYDDGGGTLEAGERIRVQIGTPGNVVTLMDEQVPAGKQWSDIKFQFQAQEDSI